MALSDFIRGTAGIFKTAGAGLTPLTDSLKERGIIPSDLPPGSVLNIDYFDNAISKSSDEQAAKLVGVFVTQFPELADKMSDPKTRDALRAFAYNALPDQQPDTYLTEAPPPKHMSWWKRGLDFVLNDVAKPPVKLVMSALSKPAEWMEQGEGIAVTYLDGFNDLSFSERAEFGKYTYEVMYDKYFGDGHLKNEIVSALRSGQPVEQVLEKHKDSKMVVFNGLMQAVVDPLWAVPFVGAPKGIVKGLSKVPVAGKALAPLAAAIGVSPQTRAIAKAAALAREAGDITRATEELGQLRKWSFWRFTPRANAITLHSDTMHIFMGSIAQKAPDNIELRALGKALASSNLDAIPVSFGKDARNQSMARLSVLIKEQGKTVDDLFPSLKKVVYGGTDEEWLKLPKKERDLFFSNENHRLAVLTKDWRDKTLDIIFTGFREAKPGTAATGWERYWGWFKWGLSTAILNRPSFVMLNIINNITTAFWDIPELAVDMVRHPTEAFSKLPKHYADAIEALGVQPDVFKAVIGSQGTIGEIQGRIGEHLSTPTSKRNFRNMLTPFISAASAVDEWTRTRVGAKAFLRVYQSNRPQALRGLIKYAEDSGITLTEAQKKAAVWYDSHLNHIFTDADNEKMAVDVISDQFVRRPVGDYLVDFLRNVKGFPEDAIQHAISDFDIPREQIQKILDSAGGKPDVIRHELEKLEAEYLAGVNHMRSLDGLLPVDLSPYADGVRAALDHWPESNKLHGLAFMDALNPFLFGLGASAPDVDRLRTLYATFTKWEESEWSDIGRALFEFEPNAIELQIDYYFRRNQKLTEFLSEVDDVINRVNMGGIEPWNFIKNTTLDTRQRAERLRLKTSRDLLKEKVFATGPKAADISAAERKVTSTKTAFDKAKVPTLGTEITKAKARLARTKAAVDKAQAAVDQASELVRGTAPLNLNRKLIDAKEAHILARDSLASLMLVRKGTIARGIEAARLEHESAQAALKALQDRVTEAANAIPTLSSHGKELLISSSRQSDELYNNDIKNIYEALNIPKFPKTGAIPNEYPIRGEVYTQQMLANVQFLNWMKNNANFAEDILKLSPEEARQIANWISGPLRGDMADLRVASIKAAHGMTNFTMLNYSATYGGDEILQVLFPYLTWPTRSMWHWGQRAWHRPGAIAAVNELLDIIPDIHDSLPDRLKNSFVIPVPGLGSPWDGHLYLRNPLNLMFPFANWKDDLDADQSKLTVWGRLFDYAGTFGPGVNPVISNGLAMTGVLGDRNQFMSNYWFSGGPLVIPGTAAQQAIMNFFSREDPLQDIRDPKTGEILLTAEQAQQLALGNPGGLAEGKLREFFGIPPGQPWDEWRIRRMVAAMAASGELTPQEALQALDEPGNKDWQKARKSANSEFGIRAFTGWLTGLSVSVYPEGEKIQKGLNDLYREVSRNPVRYTWINPTPRFEGEEAASLFADAMKALQNRGLVFTPQMVKALSNTTIHMGDVDDAEAAGHAQALGNNKYEIRLMPGLATSETLLHEIGHIVEYSMGEDDLNTLLNETRQRLPEQMRGAFDKIREAQPGHALTTYVWGPATINPEQVTVKPSYQQLLPWLTPARLDPTTFNTFFPEFQPRQAATAFLSDPEEAQGSLEATLFFQELEKTDQKWQIPMSQVSGEIDALKADTAALRTKSGRDQLKILYDEEKYLSDQKKAEVDIIKKRYSGADLNPSLKRTPRDRAMSILRSAWYDLGDQIDGKEPEPKAKLDQLKDNFLSQLPARSPRDAWADHMKLAIDAAVIRFDYGQRIGQAYENKDYSKATKLTKERDNSLELLTKQAALKTVTRGEFEQFIRGSARPDPPGYILSQQASDQMVEYMALKDAPGLTDKEKSAVRKKYWAEHPLLSYFYGSEDDETKEQHLDPERNVAKVEISRFWDEYYKRDQGEARLSYLYMRLDEINHYRTVLGLKPLNPRYGVGPTEEQKSIPGLYPSLEELIDRTMGK